MEFTHTFTVSDEQVEELKLLQKAMQNYAIKNGDTKEIIEEYYTLEKVFDFVMQLGQNHTISDKIENAAWHYDEYYDKGTYKYEYGHKKYIDNLETESEEEVKNKSYQ